MNFEIKDGTLKLFIEGRLLSDNVQIVEKEINDLRELNEHNKLIIDINKLEYTSSAGLRCFLKLAKEEKDYKIINANKDVYDVFEMTGFTAFIKISKAMREVSIEGATLIGEGFNSKVYRLNKDTLIKVITSNTDLNRINAELELCKQAFILGIPTSISFDIVKVEGRYGVVFEMLDCDCLRDWIIDDFKNVDKYAELYANLLLKINTTDKGNFNLLSAKEIDDKNVLLLKDKVSEEDYQRAHDFLCEYEFPNVPENRSNDFIRDLYQLYNDNLLMFDSDEPGQNATNNCLKALSKRVSFSKSPFVIFTFFK